MRATNVIPFPSPQRKQMRPFLFPADKRVLIIPFPEGGLRGPQGGLLDGFAIWAARFARRWASRRFVAREVRHEA